MLPRISLVEGFVGKYLLFSSSDLLSNTMFTSGAWEGYLSDIAKMYYTGVDSPIIIDIGANAGTFSIPVSLDIAKSGGVVHSFEPQRIVFYQLCGNIFLNRLDNCFAYNKAVGETNTHVSVPEINYSTTVNNGAFSFNQFSMSFHGISQTTNADSMNTVRMVNLDNIKLSKSPTFIKIDVEGHELDVIRGGTHFFENNNFPPFVFEAWDFDWYKEKKLELFEYIIYLGYDISDIGTNDFVAQHPRNDALVDFTLGDNGILHMNRSK